MFSFPENVLFPEHSMNRITQYAAHVQFLATIGSAVINVIHSTREHIHFHVSTINTKGQERLLNFWVNTGLTEEQAVKLFSGGTTSLWESLPAPMEICLYISLSIVFLIFVGWGVVVVFWMYLISIVSSLYLFDYID